MTTPSSTSIPFINETESKAIQLREELLEQLKQSNLVKELIKCHNIALDEEKSIDERYEALKFISENENLYDSLKSYQLIQKTPDEKSIDTVSILEMFDLHGHRMDYSELSKIINFIFPTEAIFKVDLDYITGCGKTKISVSQMEKYLTYILSHTHKEIYKSMQSVLPSIRTLDEYMQGLNFDEYDGWGDKNFGYFKEYIENKLFDEESFNNQSVEEKVQYLLPLYKQAIVFYYVSSISLSVNYEGYAYSTSSLYC